jgi:hypothetical protein
MQWIVQSCSFHDVGNELMKITSQEGIVYFSQNYNMYIYISIFHNWFNSMYSAVLHSVDMVEDD